MCLQTRYTISNKYFSANIMNQVKWLKLLKMIYLLQLFPILNKRRAMKTLPKKQHEDKKKLTRSWSAQSIKMIARRITNANEIARNNVNKVVEWIYIWKACFVHFKMRNESIHWKNLIIRSISLGLKETCLNSSILYSGHYFATKYHFRLRFIRMPWKKRCNVQWHRKRLKEEGEKKAIRHIGIVSHTIQSIWPDHLLRITNESYKKKRTPKCPSFCRFFSLFFSQAIVRMFDKTNTSLSRYNFI